MGDGRQSPSQLPLLKHSIVFSWGIRLTAIPDRSPWQQGRREGRGGTDGGHGGLNSHAGVLPASAFLLADLRRVAPSWGPRKPLVLVLFHRPDLGNLLRAGLLLLIGSSVASVQPASLCLVGKLKTH